MNVSAQSPRFLNRLAFAFVASFIGSILFYLIVDPSQLKLLREGDFTDYYAASVILKENRQHDLYSFDLQKEIQSRYWPSMKEKALYFRYPPFVATWLSPLAHFDPVQARVLFTIFMIACLVAASCIGSKWAPLIGQYPMITAALILAFWPMTVGLLSGQNTPLTLLLISLIFFGLTQKSTIGFVLAGIAGALLLYKPQFGLLWCLWLLATRNRTLILSMMLTVGALYLTGAFVFGWAWPLAWYQAISWATTEIWKVDGASMISLNTFLGRIVLLISGESASLISTGISSALSFLLIGWIAIRFYKHTSSKNSELLLQTLQLAVPISLLASPHTMFYDFGIILTSLPLLARTNSKRETVGIIIFYVLVFIFTVLRDQFIFQPLGILLVLIVIYIHHRR